MSVRIARDSFCMASIIHPEGLEERDEEKMTNNDKGSILESVEQEMRVFSCLWIYLDCGIPQ